MIRAETVEIVSIHADTVGRRLKPDAKHLEVDQRGRKTDKARCSTTDREKQIQSSTIDKTPDPLNMTWYGVLTKTYFSEVP